MGSFLAKWERQVVHMALTCKKCGSTLILASEIKSGMCNACAFAEENGDPFSIPDVTQVLPPEPETDIAPEVPELEADIASETTEPEETIPVFQPAQVTEEQHSAEIEETFGEFLECHVYQCSKCGGEIVYDSSSGKDVTEQASDKCMYCGSRSVSLNRVSREMAPEFILPFSVTKDQAMMIIRETMKRGSFIPKSVKNLGPESIRGVYIPYWICDALHAEACAIRIHNGRRHDYFAYTTRNGVMEFQNIPQDASLMLDDTVSRKLEPFDFSKLEIFDPSYLKGYYSCVSDLQKADLARAIRHRAEALFEEEIVERIRPLKANTEFPAIDADGNEITGKRCAIRSRRSRTLLSRDVRYALLPVWVVSFEYNGKHNTILINGDSGKLVSSIPPRKKSVALLAVGLGLAFTIPLAFIFNTLCIMELKRGYFDMQPDPSGRSASPGGLSFMIIMVACFLLGMGIYRLVKNRRRDGKTPSTTVFHIRKQRRE